MSPRAAGRGAARRGPVQQGSCLLPPSTSLADSDGVTGMEARVARVRAACSQLEDSRVTARREVGERLRALLSNVLQRPHLWPASS